MGLNNQKLFLKEYKIDHQKVNLIYGLTSSHESFYKDVNLYDPTYYYQH
jgi:hypothetical protein